MKTRISKILGVMLSISMIAGMFLFAAPVYAAPGDTMWAKESLPSGSTAVPYTSFFLWPGARVVDFAVADATTIYAAVAPVTITDLGIFKSTNSGQSWTQLTAFNALLPLPGAPVSIAVAPDNSSAIAVLDAGGKVYVSNDSGTTWSTLPALPAASVAAAVLDIGVGPARSGTLLGREYAIAVADPTAGAVATATMNGDLLIIGGTATWTPAGAALTTGIYDFTSVVFSPNFLGDRCLVAVGTKVGASTTELVIVNTATNTIVQNTKLVAAGGSTTDFAAAPAVTSIVSSDIALPTNFDPTSTGGRRAYVGIAASVTFTDNDVYRIDNDTTRVLGAVSAKPVDSVAFSGTIDAGTLYMGQSDAANVKWTTSPTTTSPTWTTSTKNPISLAAAPMTHVRVAADFATTNRVFAATQGLAAGNNNEFAISNDGGVSFNGEAFINAIAKDVIGVGGGIQAIRLTPDGKTIYVATDDGTNLNLWKASIPVSGTGYSRILFVPAGTTGALALNNDYDTTPSVFFANMIAGGVIYVSSNAGATFNNRMAPAGVTLTAIAAQDANIVYIGDAAANIYKSVNAAWTWGTAVGGKAGAVNQILVPRFDDVFVGGTGKVSYSVDGAATFTTIDTNLGGGLISVAADTLYAGNKTIFAGSVTTGVIYRWIVGTSTTWENLANPLPATVGISAMAAKNGAIYGLNNQAAAFSTARALNPLAAAGTLDWNTMAMGQDVGPALYMQVSGTATENNVYVANGGKLLYSWKDWLAVTSPSLTSPADKATLGIDPVNGRGDPLNIAFKPMGSSTGLVDTIDIEIREKATGLTGVPTIAAAAVSGVAPSLLVPGPGGAGTVFRANTEYIWYVRANNTANNAGIISKWTTPRTFTVQSGGAVVQEQIGPIVTSPQGGAVNVDPKLVAITWAPVYAATEYTVIVATDAALTKTVAGTPAKVTATAFQAATLDNSTTYFYSVQATKPTLGPQAIGSFTTAAKPVPPPAPTTPAPPVTPQIVFPAQATPAYVWAIIVIGGVLILAVIILIVRTRRVP